ncbi:STAS domain-containing protein [Streptomyces sp. cg35]|uniref:STAS domain-containing protein n=1 Tax=Streptomyces sp. cg35 TaxID=3421650 RepID=UPI003D18303D
MTPGPSMRGYFVDDLLLITPLHHAAGVRLFGEVVGAHKASLAVAVTEYSRTAEEITVDLTQVHYLANSALETLVALARSLTPPQHLRVLANPELAFQERLAAQGWDEIETLRLTVETRRPDTG